MRAIFIDAVNRKVEEVQVENELHAFYEKIGCDMIEIIHIGSEHLMVVDEEGRLRRDDVFLFTAHLAVLKYPPKFSAIGGRQLLWIFKLKLKIQQGIKVQKIILFDAGAHLKNL